jgi:nicotinate phosphoribosyltransferase
VDALLTELYQLTMAAGYFHTGMTERVATCEMFVRRLPKRRRYLVAMGLERVLDFLEHVRFTEEQIAFLATVPALKDAMTPAFQGFLRDLRFTGDVSAMPEGTVAFANEPLLRVTAPLIEAQLVETFVLSAVNHATMVASKAARVVRAAGSASVVEFGSRRTHPDAAVTAARSAYAVGCAGTSNVEAGMRFGVPVTGTAAHMWTMAHPSEEAAFEGYVRVFPSASILLIDTYDTLEGARRAAAIAKEKLKGVRLDSGDLNALSRGVRAILDEAGCTATKIVASGDLNEYKIAELRRAGAPIDVYGVGTDLVTSLDAPSLGGVYKLVEMGTGKDALPIAKFSEGKATLPGAHQVFRFRRADGALARDVIALADEDPAPLAGPEGEGQTAEALLAPVMRGGARVGAKETLEAIRARSLRELDALPPELHGLEEDGPVFTASTSPRLVELIETVRARVTQDPNGAS